LKSDRKDKAIYNWSSDGPAFGGGADLILYDGCDKNSKTHAAIGHTYEGESYSAFTGGSDDKFLVVDYEVYAVA